MAYPLPYGEYLGEVEALHLILAHDLYTELRSLISHIQVKQKEIYIEIKLLKKIIFYISYNFFIILLIFFK